MHRIRRKTKAESGAVSVEAAISLTIFLVAIIALMMLAAIIRAQAVMQNALNQKGFMVSARSTCDSRSDNPSYVLLAMGYSRRRASSCIRVSLSRHNTPEEIDAFLSALKEITKQYGKV